jgi:hypothetical protein
MIIPNLVSALLAAQRQKALEQTAKSFQAAGMFGAANHLWLEAVHIASDRDTLDVYEMRMKAADLSALSGSLED